MSVFVVFCAGLGFCVCGLLCVTVVGVAYVVWWGECVGGIGCWECWECWECWSVGVLGVLGALGVVEFWSEGRVWSVVWRGRVGRVGSVGCGEVSDR